MAKYIVQIMIAGVQVVGRAFSRALKQEFQASSNAASSRRSARDGRKETATDAYTGITLQEAVKILNISDAKDVEQIDKNYKHLYSMNDKSKGGSFYLQSKIVRAKERLDAERPPEPNPTTADTNATQEPSPHTDSKQTSQETQSHKDNRDQT